MSQFQRFFDRYEKRHLGGLDFAWAFEEFAPECWRIIEASNARSVCDVGGGRRPLFSVDQIKGRDLDYVVLDIAETELASAPRGYSTVCADICEPNTELTGRFDVVFSMFLAEHVRDGGAMHRNVYSMLRPGGVAIHVFPTLYYPAFAANRILPERLSFPLVRALGQHPTKFPARYSWCYGPTPRMRRRFRAIGYEVVEYRPFYGTYYLDRVPGLRAMETAFARWAAARHSPYLTSFARLQLRKPA